MAINERSERTFSIVRLSLLREAVINRRPGESILVVDGRSDPSFVEPLAARLLISESLIGSVSPVPVDVDVAQVATEYQISPALNRAATLPLPCADMCLLDGDALDALGAIDSAATAGSDVQFLNVNVKQILPLYFHTQYDHQYTSHIYGILIQLTQ